MERRKETFSRVPTETKPHGKNERHQDVPGQAGCQTPFLFDSVPNPPVEPFPKRGYPGEEGRIELGKGVSDGLGEQVGNKGGGASECEGEIDEGHEGIRVVQRENSENPVSPLVNPGFFDHAYVGKKISVRQGNPFGGTGCS